MLGAQVFIAHLRHVLLGRLEHRHDIASQLRRHARALNRGTPLQFLLQLAHHIFHRKPDLLQERPCDAIRLLDEREQNVVIVQFRMPPFGRVVLSGL